jgi:hypothetical protein
VTYKYPIAPQEHAHKFQLDADYAARQSLRLDLEIMLRTARLLLGVVRLPRLLRRPRQTALEAQPLKSGD